MVKGIQINVDNLRIGLWKGRALILYNFKAKLNCEVTTRIHYLP